MMISTDPVGLAAWLASARQALIVDAYTLVTTTGDVARWIDADFDFTLPAPDGRAFVRGPLIQRGDLQQSVGLSVDTLDLTLYPVYKEAPVTLGSQTLLQAAQRGSLRGATLQLERLVFANDASDYQGRWVEQAGTFAVRNTQGGVIKAQVLSELNLLDKPMPPDVYQGACRNNVFDAQCGLARSSWQVTGSVSAIASGDANRVGFTTALGQAAGWFNQGVLEFTSGLNTGQRRTVKNFSSGVFAFALPWPQAVAVADAFKVVPGCDRSTATCAAKFSNLTRYRGEPYLPQPETMS